MKLKDMNLDNDILSSFEFFKGSLISNMKKYDLMLNGHISIQDCISAMLQSNIHPKMDKTLAKSIVDIYSMKLDNIDYMKFIACLIKDARMILEPVIAVRLLGADAAKTRRGTQWKARALRLQTVIMVAVCMMILAADRTNPRKHLTRHKNKASVHNRLCRRACQTTPRTPTRRLTFARQRPHRRSHNPSTRQQPHLPSASRRH